MLFRSIDKLIPAGAAGTANVDTFGPLVGAELLLALLDPTAGAASAIAEIMLYNVFETLTKIRPDASVGPLLAQSWYSSPDLSGRSICATTHAFPTARR